MVDVLPFHKEGLDTWTEEGTYEVTREAIAAYAAATNDPIEAHLRGDIAPPVFAIVPVFDSMLEPALEVVPLSVIGRTVHGEQDFRFHRPLRPGDVLTSRGRMVGFEGLANGTRAFAQLECRDQDGQLVNEQWVTMFVRGVDAGEKVGASAPDHSFDESLRAGAPIAKVTAHVDEDQTFRYSEASGDPVPIHLDEEVAIDAGLPGIIAHGLCTMAFTSWAVLTELADGDTSRLKRLAVRFSKPVLPGQDLVTEAWRQGSSDGITTYRYETTAGDALVIRDGLAEIADR